MKVHSKIRIPDREELGDIADGLGVPKKMKDSFVTWIIELAEIMDEVRVGLNDPYADHRKAQDALKAAERAIAKAASEIASQAFYLDMQTSKDLQTGLDALLGQGGLGRVAVINDAMSGRNLEDGSLSSILQSLAAHGAAQVRTKADTYDAPYHDLSRLLKVIEHLLAYELRGFSVRGGRPRERIRGHILKELLELHRTTFSEPATPAPNGKYVQLCEHVYESFGMSTEGLDLAIRRFLKSAATSQNLQTSKY